MARSHFRHLGIIIIVMLKKKLLGLPLRVDLRKPNPSLKWPKSGHFVWSSFSLPSLHWWQKPIRTALCRLAGISWGKPCLNSALYFCLLNSKLVLVCGPGKSQVCEKNGRSLVPGAVRLWFMPTSLTASELRLSLPEISTLRAACTVRRFIIVL